MTEPDSPRRPTPYEVRTRSRSMAKSTAPIVKSPTSDPAAERRASLRREVRKPDTRNKSRVVVDIDHDKSSDSPSTSRRSATKAGDEVDSDDVLAMEPLGAQPSRRHSSSLPPHHYQDEDDDDRDELDLISPSPRSATPYEPRTRSSTQARSRSHSAVIDISDSPSPIEVLDSEAHDGDDVSKSPPAQKEIIDVDQSVSESKILIVDEMGSSVPEELQVEERPPQVALTEALHERKPMTPENISTEQKPTSVEEDVHMISEGDAEVDVERPVPHIVQYGLQEVVRPPANNDVSRDVPRATITPAAILERLQQHTNVVHTSSASILQSVPMQFARTAAFQIAGPSKLLPQLTVAPVQTVRSISIPAPSPPVAVVSPYDFSMDAEPTSPRHPASPLGTQHHFNPQYSLPPLKSLPIEFQRRSKVVKQQRKKEKEREKCGLSGRIDVRKEDCVPMGWNRWAATLRANPVWNRVARASKCLSTRDWGVSLNPSNVVSLTVRHSDRCDRTQIVADI